MKILLGVAVAASLNLGYDSYYPGLAASVEWKKAAIEATAIPANKATAGSGFLSTIRADMGTIGNLRVGAASSWQETAVWDKWTFSPYVKYKGKQLEVTAQRASNSKNKEVTVYVSRQIKDRLRINWGVTKLNGPDKRYGVIFWGTWYPWRVR